MKVRMKLILLLLLNLFILFNIIYLSFALINSLSSDIITMVTKDPELRNSVNKNIEEYHTLIIFTLVIFGYVWILSSPLIHILEWITLLGKDRHEEPTGKSGLPRSISKKRNRLKYSYIFFKNIINNLHYLTDVLKYNKEEREKIEQRKKEWIADITHDLKTPLSYVKGYSSMLLTSDQWTKEEEKRFLLQIEEKADYIETLLMNLNDVFKFDNQLLNVKKEQQDIVNFVREVLIEFANDPMTDGFFIQMVNDYNDSIIYNFDSSLIKRVLHNLLINAITHNPKKTCVDISITKDDLFVLITVKDNGVGIDPNTIRDVFNRKNKINNNNLPTGLGMSIVKQFVEAHGGNLSIKSELDKGTSVILYLPIELI